MAATDSFAQTASSAVNGNHNGDLNNTEPINRSGNEHPHAESHPPTIEDVPDESDLQHPEQPASASILEDKVKSETANAWNPPMSDKAAGKQKEKVVVPIEKAHKSLDTQSHDLFPELGGPKTKQAPNTVPIWGSKKTTPAAPAVVNGSSNGVSTNGSSRASTPASGVATPTSSVGQQPSRLGPQSMALPGRHTERINLDPSQLLSRAQLRKPLPDVIKDINKKLKATVTSHTGDRGILWLTATGPEIPCRQALQEVVAQIGSKVNHRFALLSTLYSQTSAICQSSRPSVYKASYHWQGGCEDQGIAREDRGLDTRTKSRGGSFTSGR